MSDISEKWTLLLKPVEGGQISTIPAGRTKTCGTSFIGIDNRGSRHCLIPVGTSKVTLDRRSSSVWLVEQKLAFDGDVSTYANLVCINSALFPVFQLLLEEVLRRTTDAIDPLAAVLATLNDWRALLRHNSDLPSWETIVGLRGELEVLYQLVEHSGPTAVETWTGPYGSRFDFLASTAAIEVKTTSTQSGYFIQVSGLRQLTPPVGQRLLIMHLRLEENESGPSVHDLVLKLQSLGCDRNRLFDRLQKLSYSEHQEAWGKGFKVIKQSGWEVTSDFPGLRENRVSEIGLQGVSNVQYQFDLAGAGDGVKEPEMQEYLSTFISGPI